MGILFSSYRVLRDAIYTKIPEAHSQPRGEPCLSPHMTVIEFCYMMTFLRDRPDYLSCILSHMVPAQPAQGNLLLCRFQTPDMLCSVYPNRPLACRLMEHRMWDAAGPGYLGLRTREKPYECPIPLEDVYLLLDRIAELNRGYYSYYTPPYWISGLNTETWLTVYLADIPKHVFRLLKKLITRELDLRHLPVCFTQTVQLNEKLALIDRFHAEFSLGHYAGLDTLLERIQHDFPDTGAYYYFEAEMYKKALAERTARALNSS